MNRAGGWILGLLVVAGMAAAGLIGFRSILFRKTVTIPFFDAIQWTPEREAAVRLAFSEKNFRAGPFRVEPAFVNQSKRAEHQLRIERRESFWSADGPWTPPSNPNRVYLYPHPVTVGNQTARWARRTGIRRVFLLSASAFATGFEPEAKAAGIECRSQLMTPQGRSLVEEVRAADPELVVLGRPVIPVVEALRASGYSGRFLTYDDDYEPSHYSKPQPAAVEEVLCAAAFTPVPAEFIAKLPATSRGPAGPAEYHGYLMARLVLEAVERANTDDHAAIYRTLAQSPEFNADGSSTFPGGLYVFRKGALQFVELLK